MEPNASREVCIFSCRGALMNHQCSASDASCLRRFRLKLNPSRNWWSVQLRERIKSSFPALWGRVTWRVRGEMTVMVILSHFSRVIYAFIVSERTLWNKQHLDVNDDDRLLFLNPSKVVHSLSRDVLRRRRSKDVMYVNLLGRHDSLSFDLRFSFPAVWVDFLWGL